MLQFTNVLAGLKRLLRRNQREKGRVGEESLSGNGYDWKFIFIRWVEVRGGVVVISSYVNAKHPRKTDWCTHKEPSVENLFLKLKNSRRFAIRYAKEALYFQTVILLAAILIWLL